MNKNNILITGVSGFVGKNLAKYLNANGENVFGVSRQPLKKIFDYKSLKVSDFDDKKACIHLAGKAHDLKGVSNESEYFEVNTELTKTLFNQFLQSDCAVFIYMSSVKAVADVVEGTLTEEVVANPITAYGKSKLAAEAYILSQTLPKDKRIYILRPCMIHGPGNKGNLNLLFSMAAKGVPYPLGAYHNERSFLSINNLNFVIKELLKKQPASGIYNVSDDAFLSTTELYKTMGEVLEKKLKIFNLPKKMIAFFGKVGDYIPFPLNSEKIQKLTENYRVSNAKIKNALTIEKMPLTAKTGIIKTIQSFKKTT